jgi:hypothetical protein
MNRNIEEDIGKQSGNVKLGSGRLNRNIDEGTGKLSGNFK